MLQKHKNIIYAISFVDLFAVSLIFPLFGSHLKTLGATHFIIGIIGSIYSGIQIISGPLIGSWSDVGDRKIVLRITLLLCTVCYASLGFTNSITTIFLIRMILGVVKHTQGLCKAMISDLFPPEKQAEMLSRSSALGTAGFIAGPFLGGCISELPNGFTFVSLLTSFLFLINIVLTSFLPSFQPKEKAASRDQSIVPNGIKQEFVKIGANIKKVDFSDSWHLFAIRFLFGISTTLYFHNEVFYMKDFFNLSQRHIGYVISFKGIIQTCTVFSLGHINQILYMKDKDCVRRIIHFSLIMSVSCCLLWFVNDFTCFLLCLTPFVISAAVLRISTMELLLGKCGKHQRGTFSGVSNSIMSVARFTTPVMSGIVSDGVSTQAAMLLPSATAILGTLLTLKVTRKAKYDKID